MLAWNLEEGKESLTTNFIHGRNEATAKPKPPAICAAYRSHSTLRVIKVEKDT